jgi:hypothetical protein
MTSEGVCEAYENHIHCRWLERQENEKWPGARRRTLFDLHFINTKQQHLKATALEKQGW